MTDDELKEKVKKILEEIKVDTGDREITVEEMAVAQERFGTLMVEIGHRTWILYYAARAENWGLAKSEWESVSELMELAGFKKPRHEEDLNKFTAEEWAALGKTIEKEDFGSFEAAFNKAIEQANAYHVAKKRPFLRWKLPDFPPPDLDLTARKTDS